MRRLLHWGALGPGVAVVARLPVTLLFVTLLSITLGAAPARASANPACDQFRKSIVDMEAASVRPPGWFNFDSYLRLLYRSMCIISPTRPPPSEPEYWFDIDGNSTGVPATEERPKDGAYITTAAIGDKCAGTKPGNPSMCALLTGVAAACANPRDAQQEKLCKLMLIETGTVGTAPKGDELPPFAVGLDGGPYELDAACIGALTGYGNDLALDNGPTDNDDQAADKRQGWLDTLQSHCPDFLAALQRRTGADPQREPAKFWPAFGDLLLSGFAPPPPPDAQPVTIASVAGDPGFQRMCAAADANMRICEQRQNDMRSIGTDDTGVVSQAGAFNDCRLLYGQVLGMCQATGNAAQRFAARGGAAPAPADPMSGMSARCQALVKDYIAAAQANDGQKSLAGYDALKQEGGCGVLDKVGPLEAAPAGQDPRFVSRGATPMLDQVVAPCDQSPAECAARVAQLKAGTSPQAEAAMINNAISIGLQVGALMGGAVMMGVHAPAGGGTNYRSLAPRPVRGTYGQGSPFRPAPRTPPSDITGLGR